MDLTEYFTKLKFTYEKMNSLKPPYKHCLKSHMEQMIVVKFLAGLSSDYSASKAQMLKGSDFPDLDEAFNRLNRLAVTLPPSSNNMQPSALASFGGGRGGLYSSRGRGRGRGPGGRGRLQCTFCGRLGHLEDRCWNKVGKPNTSTSPSVTSSSSSTPNTRPITLAPKANPTVASVDAISLNSSLAEIDLIMEHRSNATPSTSSASTVVTSLAYSAEEYIKIQNKIFDRNLNIVHTIQNHANLGGKDLEHVCSTLVFTTKFQLMVLQIVQEVIRDVKQLRNMSPNI
ncbi:hypothetical protein EJ110_NYTH37486 [Nymphaea thermarum]|nr:hypothetical protein EJ110_NYTH37486 [Nymphaea thermarum]